MAVPEIQEATILQAWLVGYVSAFPDEDVVEQLDAICELADHSVHHHWSLIEDEDEAGHYEGLLDNFEAGFELARSMKDGDNVYSVCLNQEDHKLAMEAGEVFALWFVGTDEQSVIDKLKAALAPDAK